MLSANTHLFAELAISNCNQNGSHQRPTCCELMISSKKDAYHSPIEKINSVLHLLLCHPKHLYGERRTAPISARAANPETETRKGGARSANLPAPSPSWSARLSQPLRHLSCKEQSEPREQKLRTICQEWS
jgi:hypothetical protein